ncbi:hypothetical protein EDD86DRAFT_197612 [Gorgonomyces haynaldii]|nr:hypothetical protein EDD86DRAFT_197612 [Gorgonomyces haynaldii]
MIGIKSSDIINPDTVNKTLSALGLGSGSVNTTALFKMIGLKSAVVDFHPTTVIDAGVNANLTLPDSLTAAVNMPFFGAGSYVADVPFAGLKVNGFKISGAGTNDLNLQSQVDIHDTPDLATVFEKLAAAFSSNQPFNTKIGGGEVLFGLDSSEANVIDSFGKVKINLDLDDLYNKIKTANVTSSIDIDGILKDLGLKLSNVDVKTAPKKTIQAAIGASFNSGFQITLNGLGYIAATTGIDTIPLVQLTASGVGLRPGQNDLKLSSDLFFPSSSAIQNKVATFVDNLINLGVGKTVEEFTANGAGFGFDKDHYFKFLEKALVRIKSSDIINPTTVNKTLTALGLGGDFKFDPKKLLDMVDISKLHLDGSVVNDNKVPAAIGVTLKNISLTASASLGYAGFGAMINDDPLLDFDLTAPLTVQSKDNNIALDLANTLKFYDSEIVQTEVAVVVSSIVNDKPVPGKVGGGGVKFGSDSSAENVIDSFATVKVKVDPNPYIPSIKNATIDLINTVLNSNSSAGVDISNVSVDAIDFVNLQIDAAAKLKGIKGDYYINVPYAQAGLTWDGVDLAVNKLQKVLLKDGTFTATIILSIVNPDLVISQQIVDIIGDVVFHRNNTYPYKAGGNYIGFGTAEDKQIKTFNKVNVGLLINDLVQGATKYVNNTRPLELIDIQAKITPDEIFAPTSIKKIGFPITIKAPINAMVTYRIPNADGYDEKKVVDVIFDNWHLDDVEHPRLIVHMIPDLGGDTAAAVSDDIVNLLTFNDYAARAYLGGLTIGSSNPDGSAFVALAFGFFRAPDLYLFNPITISVLPNWQIITKGGIELPIKIGFSFPNTGPLHLDIGSVGIDVVDGANKLLTIASPGDIIIKNNVEGGDTNGGAGNPTHGELDIILPFTDLNPAVILKLLKDLLTKTSELGIKLRFERDGKDLVWVSTVARQLDPNSIKKLIPFIAVILSHIKFEVLGLDITQNAIYQEILKLVQKWINEHFPAAASSFIGMPATLPSVNGTTATNLTARADNVIQSKLTIIGY